MHTRKHLFGAVGLLLLLMGALLLGMVGHADAASLTAAPASVPSGHQSPLTLTLTGTGTTWSGATIFSITNSVTGTTTFSKVSQTVTSATSATVVINDSSGAGTATLSDGTNTFTLTEAAAGLLLSPPVVPPSTATPIILYGTNSLWLTDQPVFTLTGGATISAVTYVSNTKATATLTTASAVGTVVVTDPSDATNFPVVVVTPTLLVSHNFAADGAAAAPAAGVQIGTTGFIDGHGGVGSLSGSGLTLTPHSGVLAFQAPGSDYVSAPSGSGTARNAQVTVTTRAGFSDAAFTLNARTSNGVGYCAVMNYSGLGLINFNKNGGSTNISATVNTLSNWLASDSIQVTFYVTSSTPAILSLHIVDVTTSVDKGWAIVLDGGSAANLSTGGGAGVSADVYNASYTAAISPAAQLTTFSFSAADVPTLSTPAVSLTSSSPSGIVLGWAASTGGSGAVTYQMYRATDPSSTPPSGTLVATTTSLTMTDTPPGPTGTLYYYSLLATDSTVVTPLTATSTELPASLWNKLSIAFIGDSITQVVGSMSTLAAEMKNWLPNTNVAVQNNGQNGSETGNWGPGAGGYLANAEANILAAFGTPSLTNPIWVSIMLGTNDARGPSHASAATYRTNMAILCTDLVSHGYKVVLQQPTYTVPYLYPSPSWIPSDLNLLLSYQGAIASLADRVSIFQGDTFAYKYMAEHPAEFADGVHPNAAGGISYQNLWARGIYNAVAPAALGTKRRLQ